MNADGVELTPATAWNFLYRWNLSYAGVIPHIVESNVLRRAAWRNRAEAVAQWLRESVASQELTNSEVSARLGLLHTSGAAGRENQTGKGLEDGVAFLIRRFNGTSPLVEASIRTLRGYGIVQKGAVDELDLVLFSKKIFASSFHAFGLLEKIA